MLTHARNLVGGLVLGTAVLVSPVAPALAAPTGTVDAQLQVADGLVNVQVGDVTILENVSIGVAASVAANLCGLTVQQVNLLAANVDQTGRSQTICTTDQGPVTITQNTGGRGRSGR
jgi:hypothetical protein